MLLKLCKGLWEVLMLTGWVRLESSMMNSKLNNLLTSVCTAVSEIDLWHLLFKLQFNWTQQPVPNGVIWSQYVYLYYVWCHELTHWHRTPTTVCVTQVQLWILFKSSNSCTWCTIFDYKSFCTCCSLTFWQLSCSRLILNYSILLIAVPHVVAYDHTGKTSYSLLG